MVRVRQESLSPARIQRHQRTLGATVHKSPRMSASSRSPVPRSRKMMFRYGKSIRKRTSRNLASLPIAKSSNSSNSRSDVAGTAACSLRTLRTFHMCCADYQGYRPRAVVAPNVSHVLVCPWAWAEGGIPSLGPSPKLYCCCGWCTPLRPVLECCCCGGG